MSATGGFCFCFLSFSSTSLTSNPHGLWKEPKTQLIFEIVCRKLGIGCLPILSESRCIFSGAPRIVLGKKKSRLTQKPNTQDKKHQRILLQQATAGQRCRRSVHAKPCRPFCFWNVLLCLLYMALQWSAPPLVVFLWDVVVAQLGLWGGEVEWQERVDVVAPALDPDKQRQQIKHSCLQTKYAVYFWNTFAMIVHPLLLWVFIGAFYYFS